MIQRTVAIQFASRSTVENVQKNWDRPKKRSNSIEYAKNERIIEQTNEMKTDTQREEWKKIFFLSMIIVHNILTIELHESV